MADEATQAQPRREYRQSGLNKVVLSGNLTHDPELKEPKGGPVKVCVLRLAVNGPVPRTPGRKQRVDYVRVDVWGSQSSNARPEAQANHLTKGRAITVIGRLQIDTARDADNRITDTYVTVVADEIMWHGGPPTQNGTPDSVQTETQGTPDSVAVEQPAPTPAAAPVAAAPEADPAPY